MTQETDPIAASYDDLPYESLPFRFSHPGHLATVGRLFGLKPPALETSRVLELGCAAGGNLIPLAEAFPEACFVGVDLSSRQVEDGRALIQGLELSNIELKAMSVTDIDETFGEFDYIIGHGIYSWVPDPVREAIMALCRSRLSDDGIAYLSYNTYPGWHISGMIREMMLFHASRFDDPKLKLQQARSLVEFLASSLPPGHPYGSLLQGQLQELRKSQDHYFFHEYLEADNQPLYFHEFVLKAMDHGLQYLGDAEFGSMFAGNFAPQVAETLQRIAPDQVSQEQYMDFLRNRTFRQTLLVHQEQAVNRNLNPENAKGLYIASAAKPVSQRPDIQSSSPEQFRIEGNPVTLTLNQPIYKAAMVVLAECWPEPISFEKLCTVARTRLLLPGMAVDPAAAAQDALLLGTEIQRSYTAGLFELNVSPAPYTTTLSERPHASRLARLQASKSLTVTNRRHENLQMDEMSRQLLLLTDGSRDRNGLIGALVTLAQDKTVTLQKDGVPVKDALTLRGIIGDYLDNALPMMAQSALLVA